MATLPEDPGGEGLFGLGTPVDRAGVLIVPVPYEATVSYGRGTSQGPSAILEASAQVDLFDLENGRPWEAGIAMLPSDGVIEALNQEASAMADPVHAAEGAGDDPELQAAAKQVDAYAERLNDWLADVLRPLLEADRLVGVLGGDHSVPFAAIELHAKRHPGLGILHVDAHADLRRAYEGFEWSHASIYWNVRERLPQVATVVGVGYRDLAESEVELLAADPRFHPFYDVRLRRRLQSGATWSELVQEMIEPLPQDVYVSFDIDGLDPTLCPNTGTPVPGGLAFEEATALLEALVGSGRRIVGFDLCEVAPGPQGEWDANVGARVLYKLIGYALRSRA